ncbi:hypothetical protein ACQKWADRAFT_17643 [Trichoderma austrokoningii]
MEVGAWSTGWSSPDSRSAQRRSSPCLIFRCDSASHIERCQHTSSRGPMRWIQIHSIAFLKNKPSTHAILPFFHLAQRAWPWENFDVCHSSLVWANAVDPADESLGQIWSLNGPSRLQKPQKPLPKSLRVKVSGGDFAFCADSPGASLASPRQAHARAPLFSVCLHFSASDISHEILTSAHQQVKWAVFVRRDGIARRRAGTCQGSLLPALFNATSEQVGLVAR